MTDKTIKISKKSLEEAMGIDEETFEKYSY